MPHVSPQIRITGVQVPAFFNPPFEAMYGKGVPKKIQTFGFFSLSKPK
jgi:hypothetical protein